MTVGDLANECGLSKHEACLIARDKIHAFERIHKGEAYGLTKTQIATLRPLFLAARPAPRAPIGLAAPMLTGFEPEGDRPMMTVKEVAEALGYQPDTIQKAAKALEAEGKIARIEIRADSSHALLLDEAQVQAVKDTLVPRTLAVKSKVDSAVTEADMAEKALDVMLYLTNKVAEQRAALALAAPKVESFDRFIDASGTLCLSDAAKALGLKPGFLFDQLDGRGYIFKRAGDWLPFQEYIDKGWFEVKTRTYGDPERITRQTRVTPKGLDALARRFPAQVSA